MCDECTRQNTSDPLFCSKCKGELQFFSEENKCRCQDGYYFDAGHNCLKNIENCKNATDLTGECTETDKGYFFKEDGSIGDCTASIEDCLECHRKLQKPNPDCDICQGTLTYTETEGTCYCPAGQFFKDDRICQPNPTGCTQMKMLSDECEIPAQGYYIRKADKVAELCSANVVECNKCTRTGEAERPTCTECQN